MIYSPRPLLAVLFATLALCLDHSTVMAQPKKAPPVAASPQSPTIAFPNPSGAQRGTRVDLQFSGTNLADPVALWLSFPAKATIPTDMNNGKDAAKLRVQIEVPADARIGFHTLRVVTKHGVSNVQLFCVDELPQIAEVSGNQSKLLAQPVPIPCVVMGKTDVEASDYFKITAKEGERVALETLGRRLGSALDPIILMYDGRIGRELPNLYSDDAPGLQSDARLSFISKEASEYFVEIRDTTHRGGADFNYRLRLGDFPSALTAFPVAMRRGSKAKIGFTGPDVDGVVPIDVAAPTDPTKTVVYVSAKRPNGISGWPVPIILTDMNEIVETEPNNEIAKANKLSVPGGVTGRFLEKSDVDYFSFAVKKGTKYVVAAETYEINSPTEVYLILKNAKGADLGKSVPANPTARIEYTATEDGDLFIHAEQTNYVHGPNEVYHLTVKAAEADFDVNLGIDRCEVAPGGTAVIPITGVIRRDFTGPLDVSVIGHPGLSGSVTIPASVGSAAPPKDGAPVTVLAYLPVLAKPDLPMGAYEFHVQLKGTANGKEYLRLANVSEVVKRSLADLAFPPREMLTSLMVGVTDKPPFMLAAKMPVAEIARGMPANVTIVATRSMGFNDEIALTALGLPANVTATAKPIAKGGNEIAIQITAAAAATSGPFTFYLRATTKTGGKDFAFYSPISLAIPAEKKNEKEKEKEKEKK